MSYIFDVTKIALEMQQKYPVLRVGQAYYNALYEYDPEQANRIEGTLLDPFYHKLNMGGFMEMLVNKGNSLTKP